MDNMPELRFPEFNNSWSIMSFSDFLISHHGGASLKPSDFVQKSDYEVIPKKAIIAGGKLNLDKNNPTYSSEEFFLKSKNAVVDNSFLITTLRDLVPTAPSIGLIVRNFNKNKLLMAQGVYGFKINDGLSPDFLTNLSNKVSFRRMMYRLSVGSTQVHLRSTEFFKIKLTIPERKEQQKIADFLSSFDNKISLLTEKQNLLQHYKKGVMQKLFSQELRFKDDQGNDFPDWKEKKLGDICSFIKDGTHGTHKDTEGSNYYLLSAKNIRNGKISYGEDDRRISKDEFDKIYKNYSLELNDVLLTVVGTIGRVCLFDGDETIAFQRSVAFFRLQNDLPNFIYQLMNHIKFQHELIRRQVVSAQPGIYLGDLAKIPLKIPSILEQQKIANFLSEIDKKIDSVNQQIEQTKTFKKGLLQQMFV